MLIIFCSESGSFAKNIPWWIWLLFTKSITGKSILASIFSLDFWRETVTKWNYALSPKIKEEKKVYIKFASLEISNTCNSLLWEPSRWFTVSVTCFFSISDRMEKCKSATSIYLYDMDLHGDKLHRIKQLWWSSHEYVSHKHFKFGCRITKEFKLLENVYIFIRKH